MNPPALLQPDASCFCGACMKLRAQQEQEAAARALQSWPRQSTKGDAPGTVILFGKAAR